MVPLHLAYIFHGESEISWVSRIPPAGSNDWGVRTFGTPMEVAMPLTGAEVVASRSTCATRPSAAQAVGAALRKAGAFITKRGGFAGHKRRRKRRR